MDNCIYIANVAVAEFSRNFSNSDIRQQVKNETGLSVRRLDNFTLTAMLATHRLLREQTDLSAVGLYSCAQYFSLELLQNTILSQISGEPVRPLDFIATVGNAANFYLAKEFSIKGPNNFVGASDLAFTKLFMLANSDLKLDLIDQAVLVLWHETQLARSCVALLLKKDGNCHGEISVTQVEASLLTNSDAVTNKAIVWDN